MHIYVLKENASGGIDFEKIFESNTVEYGRSGNIAYTCSDFDLYYVQRN